MDVLRKVTHCKMAIVTLLSSLASIAAFVGWAAEKFLDNTSLVIGVIAFIVLALMFLFALALIIFSYITYARLKKVENDYVLSHKITHSLRNAISALQELEFQTLIKINEQSINSDFLQIDENDFLKTKKIFENFGTKITGIVCDQIKNYLLNNGIDENIRVCIKALVPINDSNDQLEWEVQTLRVDHATWHNDDELVKRNKKIKHIVKNNTSFSEILSGKVKFFFHNDLASLGSQNYTNSSVNWENRYNSCIVLPIKSNLRDEKNSVYYGFLTADSLNSGKNELFCGDLNTPIPSILAHAADAIAVWFVKTDSHVKVLKLAKASLRTRQETPNARILS